MNIGNYLSSIKDQGNGSNNRRIERLEQRREYLDQTFDEMQQEAIEQGDSEGAQKIFEMSEMVENRLDQKLDSLEEKTGEFNWDRHLDNAFDKLQAEAYANDDAKMAEKIFSLSQLIGGGSKPQNILLLQKLLADSSDKVAQITGKGSQIPVTEQTQNSATNVNTNTSTPAISQGEIRTFG